MRRRSRPTAPYSTRAVLALALATMTAAGACGDRTHDLGPTDGHTLPAVDTGRVAVGERAPDFTLLDRSASPLPLSELRGRRIILAFYRGHW